VLGGGTLAFTEVLHILEGMDNEKFSVLAKLWILMII
jgi:hypothetical protein